MPGPDLKQHNIDPISMVEMLRLAPPGTEVKLNLLKKLPYRVHNRQGELVLSHVVQFEGEIYVSQLVWNIYMARPRRTHANVVDLNKWKATRRTSDNAQE